MNRKLIAAIPLTLALACAGIVGGAVAGTIATIAACTGPPSPSGNPSPGPSQPTPTPAGPVIVDGQTWNTEQLHYAAVITAVGAGLHVAPRGWVIAVAVAMQESALHNLPDGNADSVGLFQQRPSQGWGTAAQLHDPVYASMKFYTKLLTIDGWQTMPLTRAAQAVQRSAYPDAYAKWEPDAITVVATLTQVTDLTGTNCAYTVSAAGWTQPAHGHIGSGFRTADRPTHNGVDLIVDRYTPIHAAADGIVTTVRCNAIDTRTGADWGCDRDGDPNLTAGCGWYIDIQHAGGIITRYCHQQVRPFVTVGQHVTVGQIIGIVGSSGHSSGPHLHYEVHVGDHTGASAIDPVQFMIQMGAPLGQ